MSKSSLRRVIVRFARRRRRFIAIDGNGDCPRSVVSQEAVDNALAQRDTAVANLAAAEAELVVAQDRLRHCTITAPFDGRMGTAVRRVGSFVMDDPDTWPLVDLVQTDPIRVRFALSNGEYLRMFDGDLANLRSNAVVEVVLPDGRAYECKGSVEYVENMANRRTDTSPVYIRLPNPDGHLRPDGTVTVRLSSARGTERLAVPVTAVLQNVQGPYVWVVGANGAAERRPIGRGRIDGPWQFVEKGLKKGERIVADGGHKVRKGMDVEVAVKWNQQKSAEKGDASIEISFTTGELAEENRYERQELGAAVDAARVSVRYNSNVNYYTVRPKVTVDQIKNKVVY